MYKECSPYIDRYVVCTTVLGTHVVYASACV